MPPSERSGGARRPLWAMAVAGMALAAAGGVWVAREPAHTTPTPTASTTSTTQRAATSTPETGATAAALVVRPTPGAPRRLTLSALRIDARVVPVKAPDRTLVPPADATTLGWWSDGAEPGARHGSVLIAGHTVHAGSGALDHLGAAGPGDLVTVRTDRGRFDYRVATVRTYRKGALAQNAARLFEQAGRPRLVLVTCTDWDGSRYLSNTVVVARPARILEREGR